LVADKSRAARPEDHLEEQVLRRSLSVKVALLMLAGGIGIGAIALRAGEPERKIRIIYTNDAQGVLEPCG